MNIELEKSVISTKEHSEYDECAKRLLAHKGVLARILIGAVEEFKGMDPDVAVQYIEGEPIISKVPIDPGLTNQTKNEKISGLNTENSEIHEGLIRFDIIFYVRALGGLSQFIINIEAQRKEPTAYPIVNRAIFYASRMISSQKGRDFVRSNYSDLKRVYSIWICMNIEQSCTDTICLTRKNSVGDHDWKGDLNLFNVVLIGLPKELPKKDSNYELHRFLVGLLSNNISGERKRELLKENNLGSDDDLVERMGDMCNLSQGIFDDGVAKGIEQGLKQGKNAKTEEMIVSMQEAGIARELIAQIAKVSRKQVDKVLEEYGKK